MKICPRCNSNGLRRLTGALSCLICGYRFEFDESHYKNNYQAYLLDQWRLLKLSIEYSIFNFYGYELVDIIPIRFKADLDEIKPPWWFEYFACMSNTEFYAITIGRRSRKAEGRRQKTEGRRKVQRSVACAG